MIEERPATQAEAYREMVVNMGQDRPQECWILTPYDTWERNPAYVGPDEPHPEDNHPDCVPATPSYGDIDFCPVCQQIHVPGCCRELIEEF